jgi:hypothetical protein
MNVYDALIPWTLSRTGSERGPPSGSGRGACS